MQPAKVVRPKELKLSELTPAQRELIEKYAKRFNGK